MRTGHHHSDWYGSQADGGPLLVQVIRTLKPARHLTTMGRRDDVVARAALSCRRLGVAPMVDRALTLRCG